MKNIFVSVIIVLAMAVGMGATKTHSSNPQTPNTCADPTLATKWMQVFNKPQVTHALGPRAYTVNGITKEGANDWEFQGDVFVAWSTAQNFTVPMYRYDAGSDHLYSTTTTSPTPGFTRAIIIGYVYETQVCGSVPLLGAWDQPAGDHYYTTEVVEHNELITLAGWTDAGIAGFVLPLGSV